VRGGAVGVGDLAAYLADWIVWRSPRLRFSPFRWRHPLRVRGCGGVQRRITPSGGSRHHRRRVFGWLLWLAGRDLLPPGPDRTSRIICC